MSPDLAPLDPVDLEFLPWPPRPAGGMHTGTIGPGVAVRHRPTGLTAGCDRERTQPANREIALRDLTILVSHGAPGAA